MAKDDPRLQQLARAGEQVNAKSRLAQMYDQAQETKWARALRAVEAKSVPQPADRVDPPNDAPKKRGTRQKRLLTLVVPELYPNGTHGVTMADVSVRVADAWRAACKRHEFKYFAPPHRKHSWPPPRSPY
jgi:hypothetical protein